MRQPKNFFIRTYGCQMNELDSEIIVGLLEKRGLQRIDEESQADLLIYNTCSIRDLAERKVMGKLGQLGRSKRSEAIIGIVGCMANAKKDSLFKKLPHIDFIVGTNNLHQFNDVLDQVLSSRDKVCLTDKQFTHEIDYQVAKRDDKVKAYVSIIRGCDKFCTYCVVPYTRGQEVSRSPDSIVEECKKLADQGYREITLLGQNVNSYGKDKPEWNCLFHDLLARLDAIEGIERIRFMTSHPVDITLDLMHAIADLPSLCEFVHFPIQAGSNRVLRKMHRIYTVEQYLEKVENLRKIVPQVSLGTDIIVGFPTETDEEFEQTYEIMKQLEYSVAFIFAYSPRKGTPAMRWRDDIPEEVKQERLKRLLTLHQDICQKQRQDMLQTRAEILIERESARDPGMLLGRTRCWKNVLVPGPKELVGTLQNVNLHSFHHQTFIADMLDKPEARAKTGPMQLKKEELLESLV